MVYRTLNCSCDYGSPRSWFCSGMKCSRQSERGGGHDLCMAGRETYLGGHPLPLITPLPLPLPPPQSLPCLPVCPPEAL